MKVRITAPSRLHFGLLHVPAPGSNESRKYGGLGVMLDSPAIRVEVSKSDSTRFGGSLAERAAAFLREMNVTEPLHVIADGPPEHTGLGIGTALGMALAKALAIVGRESDATLESLARRSGRGNRSSIGVLGFQYGGLIVDGGKSRHQPLPDDWTHHPWPAAWQFLLIRPNRTGSWSGDRERLAFQRDRDPIAADQRKHELTRLITDVLLPALAEKKFADFARGLTEYNRRAGEPFAADQGGAYAGPDVERAISLLAASGVTGYGQSSWGPTVFGLVRCDDQARELKMALQSIWNDDTSVEVSRVSEHGASIEVIADDEPESTD